MESDAGTSFSSYGEAVFPQQYNSNLNQSAAMHSPSLASSKERMTSAVTWPSQMNKKSASNNKEACGMEECKECNRSENYTTAQSRSLSDKVYSKPSSQQSSSHLETSAAASSILLYCNNDNTSEVKNLCCSPTAATDNRSFRCEYCGKMFAQKHNLQIHTRTHTGEKPFSCPVCPAQFARRDTLRVHCRIHTGERPYPCDLCPAQFAQRDKLTIHRRTHTLEKPYGCDFCIQTFARRDTLQIHRRIHTGEKPFCCDSCPKRFAQSDKLQRHRRTHKKIRKPSYYKPTPCKNPEEYPTVNNHFWQALAS